MSGDVQRVTEAQVRRELLRIEDQEYRRRMLRGAAVVLAVALVVGVLAAQFLFVLAEVRGDGMARAVGIGDVALCVRVDAPLLGAPAGRGSLALVRYADNGLARHTIRRVIAVGGDEIALDETGRVTLNGALLDEPYAAYRAEDSATGVEITSGGALENPFAGTQTQAAPAEEPVDMGLDDLEYPLTVPEDMLFVLCDDRDDLLDSRSSRFGLVKAANVEGLARAVVWPVCRARMLPDSEG